MRSNSFAWLMNTSGLNAAILEGGYKCFRNYVLNYFANKFNLILIGGPTGSGKSEVLRELADRGEQILDLEKLQTTKALLLEELMSCRNLLSNYLNIICSLLLKS